MACPDDFYEIPKFQFYMSNDVFNKNQYNKMISFMFKHNWDYVDFDIFKANLYNGILKKKDFVLLKRLLGKHLSNFYTFNKILEMY
jgi:hypothetical protein